MLKKKDKQGGHDWRCVCVCVCYVAMSERILRKLVANCFCAKRWRVGIEGKLKM